MKRACLSLTRHIVYTFIDFPTKNGLLPNVDAGTTAKIARHRIPSSMQLSAPTGDFPLRNDPPRKVNFIPLA